MLGHSFGLRDAIHEGGREGGSILLLVKYVGVMVSLVEQSGRVILKSIKYFCKKIGNHYKQVKSTVQSDGGVQRSHGRK